MLKYVIIIGLVGAVAAAVLISSKRKGGGKTRTLLIEEPIQEIKEKVEDLLDEIKEEVDEKVEDIVEEILDDENIDLDIEVQVVEEEEIDYLEQMRLEEEAAEACYGMCMNCRHYCKDPDPDIVFGHCHLNDTEMLYDDGCYDFEDRED